MSEWIHNRLISISFWRVFWFIWLMKMIPWIINGEFSLSISLNCSPIMDLSVEEWTYQPCVEVPLTLWICCINRLMCLAIFIISWEWVGNRYNDYIYIFNVYISYQNGFASYPYHYMKPLTLKVTDYGLVSPSALVSPWSFIYLAKPMSIDCIVSFLNPNSSQPEQLLFYLNTLVHPFTGKAAFFGSFFFLNNTHF